MCFTGGSGGEVGSWLGCLGCCSDALLFEVAVGEFVVEVLGELG